MNEKQLHDAGAALLRVSLGIMLLAHSAYLKIFVFSVAGTVGFFESLGLPAFAAYLTMGVEIVAGLALIAGYQVRLAALAVVPVLLGATWAHWGNGWLFSNANGGWEYPLFLVVATLVQAMIGGGVGERADVSRRLLEPAVASR